MSLNIWTTLNDLLYYPKARTAAAGTTTFMDSGFGVNFHRYLVLCIVVLVLLGLAGCGKKEDEKPLGDGQAKAEPDPVKNLLDVVQQQNIKAPAAANLSNITGDLNFPPVTLGDDQTQGVVLNNTGDEPLTITGLKVASDTNNFRLGGACAENTVLDAAQKTCRLDVTFTPAEARLYQTTLVITHSGKDSPLFVNVSGTGENRLDVQLPTQPVLRTPSQMEARAAALQQQRMAGKLGVGSIPTRAPKNNWLMSDKDYEAVGGSKTVTTYPIDRTRLITADRYIPAVLENTINSQINGGRVIAVVENHVYSGEGRNILIPAGSRIIGQYESLQRQGNTRLSVFWRRIIRPDGVGIDILGSTGADPMGRQGLIGDVDNRYFERYGVPLLVSAVGIAANYAASPSEVTTTSFTGTNNGVLGTQTSETLSKEAAAGRAAGAQLLDLASRLVQENIDLKPIVTVPAGTRLLVIPTRDIEFKTPQLITAAGPSGDLISEAQNLIKSIQRGDGNASSEKLVQILGQVAAQQGGAGANPQSPDSAFGLDAFGSARIPDTQQGYGGNQGQNQPPIKGR